MISTGNTIASTIPNLNEIERVNIIPKTKKDPALINPLKHIAIIFCIWVISFVTLVTNEPVLNLSD